MKVGKEYILIPPEEKTGEPEPNEVWETALTPSPAAGREREVKAHEAQSVRQWTGGRKKTWQGKTIQAIQQETNDRQGQW